MTFHDVDDFIILLYLFINSLEKHADHANLLDALLNVVSEFREAKK